MLFNTHTLTHENAHNSVTFAFVFKSSVCSNRIDSTTAAQNDQKADGRDGERQRVEKKLNNDHIVQAPNQLWRKWENSLELS